MGAEGSTTCLNYRATYFGTCCKPIVDTSDQSQLESIESCDVCGKLEVDWEARVDYEGSDISCGEFGWIFNNKIEEGSKECLDYRAMYFGKCCKIESSRTGCD